MRDTHNPGSALRPGRITVDESFLDLVDQLAYGDLETWRRVYAAALVDDAVRAAVDRAAAMVDPDFASAGALWRTLVARMPPVVSRGAPVAIGAADLRPMTRRTSRRR